MAGEKLATKFLQTKGYHVVANNLANKQGELDVVAIDEVRHELVFVEVKTRTNANHLEVDRLVTPRQLMAWRRMAGIFLEKHQLAKPFRFDIIYILNNSIQHFENITME